MRKTISLALASVGLLVCSTVARADPYVVLSRSSLVLDFEGDGFNFAGEGFSVMTVPDPDSMGFGPFYSDGSPWFRCDPCTAGDTFNPGFTTNGEVFLGLGRATFGDASYSDLELFGTLAFLVTPVAFPSSTSDGVEVRAPFSFIGTMRGMSGSEQVFTAAFAGAGHVSHFYDLTGDGRYTGGENRITFLFESPANTPVPEPATLLLVASGIGGALTRARSRKKRNQVA